VRIEILRQQADVIAARQQLLEARAGGVASPDHRERIDVPERADIEGIAWLAEIVGVAVTHDVAIDDQLALDGRKRREEARIAGVDESELGQQQRGRVNLAGAVERN